ncbi:MAG: NAD-dependent epimerase/dehydratase family protein, partial [Paracoccaceae bacterium]
MKKILLIGNSGGVGAALDTAWRAEGNDVTGLSRRGDAFDITDESLLNIALAKFKTSFDVIFIATGGLETENSRPEKSLSEL